MAEPPLAPVPVRPRPRSPPFRRDPPFAGDGVPRYFAVKSATAAAAPLRRGRGGAPRGRGSVQHPVTQRGVTHTPELVNNASSGSVFPSDSKRRRARACFTRGSRRLGVGGDSWHVIPWPRTEGESPLVGAAPFHSTWVDHNQRGTARARSKLDCCASSPATASAGARVLASHAAAGLALEATAGTSYHGRAPKERALSSVQHPSIVHGSITTSVARRARSSKLDCCASSPATASDGGNGVPRFIFFDPPFKRGPRWSNPRSPPSPLGPRPRRPRSGLARNGGDGGGAPVNGGRGMPPP